MQKRVFRHKRTLKAQINLRIRKIWPMPTLPAYKLLDTIEYNNGKLMPGWNFVHVQDDAKRHILRVLKGTFSLDAAHIIVPSTYEFLTTKMDRNRKYMLRSP